MALKVKSSAELTSLFLCFNLKLVDKGQWVLAVEMFSTNSRRDHDHDNLHEVVFVEL